MNNISELISNGKCSLGIELGSTRIKAVLVSPDGTLLANGSHLWQNCLIDGIWSYSLDDVKTGIRACYKELSSEIETNYKVKLTNLASIGVSAMMHGYLVFDKSNNLLVPFRSWRNTITSQASTELTELFGFHVPQRWSISHLYQAILNKEEHTDKISFLTTLAGYVHYMLTGEKVLGIGDASGVFPLDNQKLCYNKEMCRKFNEILKDKGYKYTLENIIPTIKTAGEIAGTLTDSGALYLDPTGTLKSGALAAPPEGDAETGMVATNSITARGGNISAGTSIFAMVVLEKALKGVHKEIDIIATPDGLPVAMVHGNTCTSDFDAWVSMFYNFASALGLDKTKGEIYDIIYTAALNSESDVGNMVSYNCYAGEPIVGIANGRPLFVRNTDTPLNFGNFSRALLYSLMAPLRVGMDILTEKENIAIDSMLCHGGLFKTPIVAQKLLAGALNIPLSVMDNAGEGGPWGMALLASFIANKQNGEALQDFLSRTAFKNTIVTTIAPENDDVESYNNYLNNYKSCLPLERDAAKYI